MPWYGRVILAGRSFSETKRIRYLLGLSSPAEREHIESEFFEDEDAFQEMLAVEDDLIDTYARNELTSEDRRRFERSFVSSLGGKNRVQFARAFAGAVAATRPDETKPPSTLLDVFKIFQLPSLVRTATIAAVVVFIAVLAWLIIDRRIISNEIRELRAESAELSKRTEEIQRSSDTERTADMNAQPADLRAEPNKSRYRDRPTTAPRRVRQLPAVKNGREKFEMLKVGPGEQLLNVSDASLGNTFVDQNITQPPLNARTVANLLSLQPAVTPSGYIPGARSDQANTALDGVNVNEQLNPYFLQQSTGSSGETIVRIPASHKWIRFQISLETAAIHDDYRLTIRAADGRPVTSVIWIEPLTPNQTIIDTPAISTSDLPSGDYVLLLEGAEPDGSFIKVAEHSFKVIKS